MTCTQQRKADTQKEPLYDRKWHLARLVGGNLQKKKKKVSGLQRESLLTFEWKHHNTDAKCVYNVWGTDELIFPFLFLSSRRAERRGIISHSLFFLWLYFHLIFYITHSLSDITHKPVKPATMPSNAVINTTAFKGSDYADSPGKRMVRNTRQM